MASAPSNKIERAHQMYREGKYWEALGFYTEALSMAKTKPQKIALHSNRAACFLKLHDFNKAADECTSVLELDRDHTGALMLRAQTLVTLKEYHSALFDVNRLIELNPSSEAYQNLQARLKTQLSLAPIPESEAELEEEEEYTDEAEPNRYGEGTDEEENAVVPCAETVQDAECNRATVDASVVHPKTLIKEDLSKQEMNQKGNSVRFEQERDRKVDSARTTTAEVVAAQAEKTMELPKKDPKGWQAIPKPKGHSALDYARLDRVEDDSSEEDDDDDDEEESQPQYRFRVRTVGVRSVK